MSVFHVCGWLLTAVVLVGCSAYRPVALSPAGADDGVSAPAAVQPGDRVRVTLTSGQRVAFSVVEVREDALVGESVVIPYETIEALESSEFSQGRTAVLAGGLSAGTVLLLLAALSTLAFMP